MEPTAGGWQWVHGLYQHCSVNGGLPHQRGASPCLRDFRASPSCVACCQEGSTARSSSTLFVLKAMRSATPNILAVQPKPARFKSSSRNKKRLHFSRNWLASSAPYQPSGASCSGLKIASPSHRCRLLFMVSMAVKLAVPQPGMRPDGRRIGLIRLRLRLGGSREQAAADMGFAPDELPAQRCTRSRVERQSATEVLAVLGQSATPRPWTAGSARAVEPCFARNPQPDPAGGAIPSNARWPRATPLREHPMVPTPVG